jgi:hypothetical protein
MLIGKYKLTKCARPGDRAGFFVPMANQPSSRIRSIPESETALPEMMIDAFLFSACIIRSGLWSKGMQPKKRFGRTNSTELQVPISPPDRRTSSIRLAMGGWAGFSGSSGYRCRPIRR